ncbi:hypothetical protein [Breoghania sp.]|uniref:hypothetical protein n=1 Tax=Breoghania sp. TaxID=2065378 RepID=UPI002618AC36|nr:hypothetical protein [Breoghania sp.]MDJ0933664.1 hypothetical protein [Breoghania sp.]
MSKHYQAPILFVSITSTLPGPVAHTPEEYAQKLKAFAEKQKAERGIEAEARTYTSPDPARDLDTTLTRAICGERYRSRGHKFSSARRVPQGH